jgi:cytochrome oxidase assembly protein ShyY1
MRRWGFIFRPGWLALALVVIAFTYLCFTILAPWQLGKNTRTTRANHQIETSLKADPVPLTSILPKDNSAVPELQWRRVTATGHYLAEHEVLARLRIIQGNPAYEVLTPFAIDGGPKVLVDRGYVLPVQGSHVPPFAAPPPGTLTINAWLRDSENVPANRTPLREDGVTQVYAVDTQHIAQTTGVPLVSPYLQLMENQPGGLGVIPLPHLDAGPFLSYGIQWIAFGIVAPIGLGYFVYAEIRMRRHESAAQRRADDVPAEPVTVEDKLADRYGRRR